MQVNLPRWLSWVETSIGFVLPPTSHQWLTNAITQTALRYNVSADGLFDKIQIDTKLAQSFIDSVTISETRFFRDEKTLEYIGELYVKHTKSLDRPFSVVSIGVSTGQELWSVGLMCQYLSDTVVLSKSANYQLIGLDVNEQSLKTAKACVYPAKSLDRIDKKYHQYLQDVPDTLGLQVQLLASIQDKASFALCNLFDKDDLPRVLYKLNCPNPDVIICQNMLIYFRRFDQRDILSRMTERLPYGGVILLAAGEGLFWQDRLLQKIPNPAVNGWQKIIDR